VKRPGSIKKILIYPVFLFFSLPALCSADFEIKLKDGTLFETRYYYEENSQVRFYLYGGTVGFPKSSISYIKKTPDRIIEEKETGKKTAGQYKNESGETVPSKEKVTIQEEFQPDKSAVQKKKQNITAGIQNALSALRRAKLGHNRPNIKKERTKIMILKQELSELKKKTKKYYGRLPDWW
jgi:hypothetical protein